MITADILFLVGGAILGFSPWLQVFRIWKLKKADILSGMTLLGIVTGLLFNEIAAVFIWRPSLLAANSVSLIAWSVILSQKIYYEIKQR